MPAQKVGQLWFWPAVAQGWYPGWQASPWPTLAGAALSWGVCTWGMLPFHSSQPCSALSQREQTCWRSRYLRVSPVAPSAEAKLKVPGVQGLRKPWACLLSEGKEMSPVGGVAEGAAGGLQRWGPWERLSEQDLSYSELWLIRRAEDVGRERLAATDLPARATYHLGSAPHSTSD